MKEIGIGLLGWGTVGSGVVAGLQRHAELLAQRTGVRLVLRGVADLDWERDRGVALDRALLSRDAAEVVDRPDVDVVVECIGGTGVARTMILKALAAGKPVVTANKALLAEHGPELYAAAAAVDRDLLFEASVGGGIPVIRALREGLCANRIEYIEGILNGTCNYILTRMEEEGLPFDEVLREAQAAGFAEAEPGLDIDGLDTAHKTVVLASQAFGCPVTMQDVAISGIRGIQPLDIHLAAELGYRIKLLALIQCCDGALELSVCPTLVARDRMLASVGGVFNAVVIKGDIVGETLYYGKGAGRDPTASAVLADIVDAARNLVAGGVARIPAFRAAGEAWPVRAASELHGRAYVRLSVSDAASMTERLTALCRARGVGVESLTQRAPQPDGSVPVVLLLESVQEQVAGELVAEIAAWAEVTAPVVRYRVEPAG